MLHAPAGYPAKHFRVLHQRFLTKSTRHVQDVEWRCVSQAGVGHQSQSPDIANRTGRLTVDAISRIGNPRQDFERSRQIDLIDSLKQKRAGLQVNIMRKLAS